ncbi:HAD family hydrolase [Tessaracoccus caeni]|uniref:HAD family hydrolase n=1 Tax=Tessaracoccus caeni TaxID=3031239 RepID=UPI0023DA438D|nr:HAD family phosphatase [Tessaracoccus caeni]MDF1489374.1 HAD family phosphatase [Tessaracoccus caeni]
MNTVIFDIGQVIIHWNPRLAFEQAMPADEVEAFMTHIGFDAWNKSNDARPSTAEATEELVLRFPQDEAKIRAYLTHFPITITDLEPGTSEVIADLQAAGIRLGAVTNWAADTFQIAFRTHDVLQRFEEIVVSGVEGVMKPAPEIFLTACSRLGIEPADAVFIDDSPVNVTGAEAVGMTGIVFQSAAQLRADLVALGLL